jgi:hypothetical protein
MVIAPPRWSKPGELPLLVQLPPDDTTTVLLPSIVAFDDWAFVLSTVAVPPLLIVTVFPLAGGPPGVQLVLADQIPVGAFQQKFVVHAA